MKIPGKKRQRPGKKRKADSGQLRLPGVVDLDEKMYEGGEEDEKNNGH